MRTSKFLLAGCAALVIAAAPFLTAMAAQRGALETSQIHTKTSYSSRSVEAAQIRAWLERHAAYYPSGAQIGDPSKITGAANGTILVERIRSISSDTVKTFSVTDQEPPMPLPGSGTDGEIIAITHSVGPYTYSWTYQWFANEDGFGGKWVLLDYEMHFNPDYRKPR